MSLFSAESVQFASRTQKIVNGVSLSIEKGTVTGLLGKSGSGKSTLLKLLAGILVPTSGRVFFDGKDIQLMTNVQNKQFRKKCAFVFQDSALWENQTIEQNLLLPLQTQTPKMSAPERASRISEVCEIVGYNRPLSLRPVDLSMGEQKRVAFARAFISKPEVLFLDECTESLDIDGVKQIMRVIKDFILNGNTVLYVSHRESFINAMGGTIFEVEKGYVRGIDDYEI